MNIKEFFPDPPPKKKYTIEDEVQDEFNEFCNPKRIEPDVVLEQVDSVNKVLEHMRKTDPELFDKYSFKSVYETAVYINNVLSKKVYTEDETAMFFDTLLEDGRIVKNVNTTIGVNMDEIAVQARKMGFNVTTGGVPAYLTPDGVHPEPINESIITEGRNHPVIVVDVQPEYEVGGDERTMTEIIQFVNNQTGPVLMFINAEDTGMSDDTKQDIQMYWQDKICGFKGEEDRYDYDEEYDEYTEKECDEEINWDRFKIVDKGYGYFRGWMDSGIEEGLIIKVIRTMYQQKISDSRALFGGEGTEEYVQFFEELIGELPRESISVEWTSVAQLKQFNGAYIVGGGRDECLREVELLMNAFNIKYKRIDKLVYG